MNIMQMLDDRITVNSINEKREAVAALLEFREALLAVDNASKNTITPLFFPAALRKKTDASNLSHE